ncbi:MAG: CRTAC1 family protein [Defluviimonas sp.]|uniref:CRTAC1 family protein n=1 Tax=Albidovulum sp. TaxID=1872424 RepID=UPI001D79AB2D|nr:CRTAC1 family protein [Paracoccaceae bacterium]MCC0065260.1 CRTAC1 family protein [Defluviimonas sp.]
MIRLLLLLLTLAAAPALGAPRFVDESAALPVAQVYAGDWEHFVGGGVAVFDCNGDSRPDIFAAGGTNPARLFVNETPAAGRDFAFRAGDLGALGDLTGVTGAYPLDIDGDGTLDLAVLRVGPDLLLKGDGLCGFRDASADWGFVPGDHWTTAFSATWEPGRQRPTLAFGHYVDRFDPNGPFEACDHNDLFRPEGTGYGAPVPLEPGFCALSMLISDWQRSGHPELRISNDRQYYVRGGYEQMWRLDPLKERGAEDGWDKVSLWGMGIASGDVNGDGMPDVMLTSMGDQLLELNEHGRLVRVPYGFGTYAQRPFIGDEGRPSTGWHSEFADIDNDGRLDLFIAKGNVDQMPSNAIHDPNNLLMQGADGTFREMADVAGIATTERSRGAALADFDGDGRLDLVVMNRRAPMELWRNVTEGTGNWLAVSLRMVAPNTRAIGAWVELRTAAGVQAREVTVGGGHAGGQAGPVHFGLGAATSAAIRVLWPDGQVGDWQEVGVNRALTLAAPGMN